MEQKKKSEPVKGNMDDSRHTLRPSIRGQFPCVASLKPYKPSKKFPNSKKKI